jgi:hypothetical protein
LATSAVKQKASKRAKIIEIIVDVGEKSKHPEMKRNSAVASDKGKAALER